MCFKMYDPQYDNVWRLFFYIFLSKNCLNFLKFQELVKVYQQERNSRLSRIRYG